MAGLVLLWDMLCGGQEGCALAALEVPIGLLQRQLHTDTVACWEVRGVVEPGQNSWELLNTWGGWEL